MNVLVTGAAGYVGSVCAAELVKRKYRVVGYDNLSAGYSQAVAPGVRFIRGDVADRAKLIRVCRKYGIGAVMHFAGSILVSESLRDPHLYYRNNVAASIELLQSLMESRIKKFIFSSTAAVYGEPQKLPLTEEHPVAPVNAYGETKLAIERALGWYHRAYGLNCAALRYFNAAGATDLLGEDHRPETHLLPRLIDAAMHRNREFVIYGEDYPTPDGTCIRDFVHVVDIAQAHILALQQLDKIGWGVYNIGHGMGYSVREVIRAVEEITGQRARIRVGPRRPGDPVRLVASPHKIMSELGWRPRYSDLSVIVRTAWEWRRRFPKGYEKSRSRKAS